MNKVAGDNVSPGGPLLLEGYGLRDNGGRTSLCIGVKLKGLKAPYTSDRTHAQLHASTPVYEYKM